MPDLGSIETASGGTASWFESSTPALAHASVGTTNWTLTGWFKLRDDSSTAALIEYASSSTVTSITTMMALGVYRLANGSLRVQHDRSTGSLGLFHDFPVAIGSAPFFLGLVKTIANQSQGTITQQYELTIDGVVRGEGNLPGTSNNADAYSNGRWVLGASRRWGTSAGDTPAFATAGVRIDDVAFFTRAMTQEKLLEVYRNGLRSWHEKRLFESNSQRIRSRVLVEDGDGVMVDLSALYDVDFVKSADVKDDVETQGQTASVTLLRQVGPSLNLSPLAQDSALNLNASAAFEALLELRRKIRIDYAVTPNEWTMQGWEWEPAFEGFIDDLSWQADTVTVVALDKIAPLVDAFQLDPKPYNYYQGAVLSETHIQRLINDNVPRVLTGSSTLTFGYLGGTPTLYTPASSGWVLNYDDAPAAPVASNITAVADQIGWTVRHKWYDPWQEYRLTYFAPPRLKRLDIESISEDPQGFTTIVTRTPHGLMEDQAITISGTTNYNGATTVDLVLAYNEFRTLQTPAGTPATEATGRVVYGPHVTLSDEQVVSYEPLRKHARDIRNAAVVKYNRVPGETATLPVTTISGGSGSPIQVLLDAADPSYGRTLVQLEVGQTFEVFGCPDVNANVKDTISAISGANVIGSVNITPALSASSAGFKSDYLRYKTAYAMSTPSITKYGLRQAAVYEASNGNINTVTEAYALASAIVSDLAEPTADVGARLHCAPWFELHDLINLSPDKKGRWSAALQTAVTGVNHHFEGGGSYTNLLLRSSTSASLSGGAGSSGSAAAPTGGVGWVTRIIVEPKRPAITDKVEQEVDLNIIGASLGGKMGRQFTMGLKPPAYYGQLGGRARMRQDMVEVHLSTEGPDFIPDGTTLAHAGRGT